MTSYNGNAITYDAIGNPTNDGEWNYAWEKGRQLSRMSKSGTSWTFTYDANGLRTGRKNAYYSSQTYQYQYSGGLLRSMQVGNEVLAFDYDANGTPLTVTYNGAVYHYVTNLQGDVVQILDIYGSAVAWYTYDAWGNTISNIVGTANVGLYNPLRYRGYVYDRETGLYYLQSRYYNPEWGRFINADDPAYLGADGTPISYNLYAYCGNNPAMCYDPLGRWTVSFGISISAFAIGGATRSWFISFDGEGNMAIQKAEADITKKSSGGTFGIFSAGVVGVLTFTQNQTVDDLVGVSLGVGGTVTIAAPWVVGADIITNVEMDRFDGFSLCGGIGTGTDAHITLSITETVYKENLVLWG